MQTLCHYGLNDIYSLTYYATFWPETGLKPIMLDWPDQKLIEKCSHLSGDPGAFGIGLYK